MDFLNDPKVPYYAGTAGSLLIFIYAAIMFINYLFSGWIFTGLFTMIFALGSLLLGGYFGLNLWKMMKNK